MDAKKFFYDFGKALYHVDAVYEEFAKSSGVTSPTLLWILYALNDGGEHTQREICANWDLPKSTVNTVMSELRQNGYVELVPIKGKCREMTIVLTESGKAYAESILAGIYEKEAKAFEKLHAEERNVIAYLEKIVTLLCMEETVE
jgi:DNA-binding MarR family transcriptional regulator